MKGWRAAAALVLLVGAAVASGVLVAAGEADGRVGLGSLSEIWADFIWDADRSVLNLTRVSAAEENRLGDDLAGFLAARERPAEDEGRLRVAAIGASLNGFVERPAIDYEFHVIDADSVNAMALPGGHLIVTRGMLEFVASDDELAAVVGHEIAHVDRRHCIERYQNMLALQKTGAGALGVPLEIMRRLAAQGYRQYQEIEADEEGLRMAAQAGYDPAAGAVLLERLAAHDGEPVRPAAGSPAGEAIGSLERVIGSYGRSHPPSRERAARLRAWARRHAGPPRPAS